MGHRPLAGSRVVLERERLALVGQVVEGAALHRLADLALDEALPRRADLAIPLGVASVHGHGR